MVAFSMIKEIPILYVVFAPIFFPLLVYIFFIDDFKNISFYDLLYDGA